MNEKLFISEEEITSKFRLKSTVIYLKLTD